MNTENTPSIRFDRIAQFVAADISASWINQEDPKTPRTGKARIFVIEEEQARRLFLLQMAVVYESDYTLARWPRTRGPQIASMQPGEMVGYKFHQSVLPFIKVEPSGSAANLHLSEFQELDLNGNPIEGSKGIVRGGTFTRIAGIRDNGQQAFLTLLHVRNQELFLVSTRVRRYQMDELKRIEDDLMEDFNT